MSVDDVFFALAERDATLHLVDGRLRYAGPKLAANDPLLDAINVYRDALTELFTYRPIFVSESDDDVAPSAPGPCLIAGCLETLVDIAYCADHRRMADDGTLWLRCVNHPDRPVAPHDSIACAECRAQIDA